MSKKSTFLVMLQIAAMVFLVIYNKPIVFGYVLLFQIFGIVIGIWAIYTLRIGHFNIQPEVKSDFLIKNGPYKWIRNPMYSAVILFYLPIIIQNFSYINVLIFIILFGTLIIKIFSEEQFLEEQFGEEYLNYKSKTKRIIPFII